MVLLGEVTGPVGYGDLLEEVHYWGWVLRVYSLALHPACSLLPVCSWDVIRHLLALATCCHNSRILHNLMSLLIQQCLLLLE